MPPSRTAERSRRKQPEFDGVQRSEPPLGCRLHVESAVHSVRNPLHQLLRTPARVDGTPLPPPKEGHAGGGGLTSTVVFIIGGPGSGRDTLIELLRNRYDFVHLSMPDMFHVEVTTGGEHGGVITSYQERGQMVPDDITFALLRRAMDANTAQGRHFFLINGFLNTMREWKLWRTSSAELLRCHTAFAVLLDCPESVRQSRILHRAAQTGEHSSDQQLQRMTQRSRASSQMAATPPPPSPSPHHFGNSPSFLFPLAASDSTRTKLCPCWIRCPRRDGFGLSESPLPTAPSRLLASLVHAFVRPTHSPLPNRRSGSQSSPCRPQVVSSDAPTEAVFAAVSSRF